MFKRSLASVAAVAIASGAVVAPANAVAVRPHNNNNNKTCTFSFAAEEAKLIPLKSGNYPQEKITNLKSTLVGPQLPTLRAQIKKYEEELAKDEVNDDLMRKLEESNKKLTAYEKLNEALDACINGKYYNSDQSSGPKKPEDQGNPGESKQPEDQGNPGAPGNPGASNNPEDQGNPGAPGNPGASNNPEGPSNPGAQPAPPSTDGAGIGVIFAGAIAAVLGILAAALPIIKSILPPQLRALLP
ncbi:hypothetical protein CIP107512_01922 [Corynebacterium diphtheriae]|nr:hypothetical protein CIP107512_01922 [Corynebacterium diphtheriae]CAB0706197.1 hypothetical protein FRC0082_01785 [Corynebacterium diphtheriae]CAB0972027.1 hypothetical protein FRC0458_02096 [Corynebacterium diphtheriae]